MIDTGIEKEEPFSVSGAIFARLQASNDVMKNRIVGDALTKALGELLYARPFTSGTQMIWRKRNCISTRTNFVRRLKLQSNRAAQWPWHASCLSSLPPQRWL